jgi:hypothetical protein
MHTGYDGSICAILVLSEPDWSGKALVAQASCCRQHVAPIQLPIENTKLTRVDDMYICHLQPVIQLTLMKPTKIMSISSVSELAELTLVPFLGECPYQTRQPTHFPSTAKSCMAQNIASWSREEHLSGQAKMLETFQAWLSSRIPDLLVSLATAL